MTIVGLAPDGRPVRSRPTRPAAPPARKQSTTPSTVKQAAATAEPSGAVTAVLAMLNAIDKQGDVLLPGLIGAGQDLLISAWGHATWEPGYLPVGAGRVTEEAGRLVLRGRFFLDTPSGRATYDTLRGIGGRAEWSFGFLVTGSRRGTFGPSREPVRFLDSILIVEASPVLLGASVGSGTVALAGVSRRSLALGRAAARNARLLAELRTSPRRREVEALVRHARSLGVRAPSPYCRKDGPA